MSRWISLFYICTHCLSFYMRRFPLQVSMVFYSCPVPIFGLCWKILFPSTNLCACHNTYNLYSHSLVKEGDLQLIIICLGILGIQGRFYEEEPGRTCRQLDCLCIFVTFSFINVGCWELTCFMRETRQKGKSHSYIRPIKKHVYDDIWGRILGYFKRKNFILVLDKRV